MQNEMTLLYFKIMFQEGSCYSFVQTLSLQGVSFTHSIQRHRRTDGQQTTAWCR